jgi:hypothetical protein
MHRRRSEVEALLRQWCRSRYGAHWLRAATEERGVIRVKPGQSIPVVHFIALADKPIFIAPQQRVKEGHRMVGPNHFRSGNTLEEGELALTRKSVSMSCRIKLCWQLRLDLTLLRVYRA